MMINDLAKRVTDGVVIGWTNEEVKQTARQFMKDNNYKITEAGKQVAIAELEDLDYPKELTTALTTAIALLED